MSSGTLPTRKTDYSAVKAAIHRKLIQKLNLDRLGEIKREDVRREVAQILRFVDQWLATSSAPQP